MTAPTASSTGPTSRRLLSPAGIAAALGRPAPTPEQEAVITAPLAPGVVIAGAGSGKTETMAARVVWLVANGYLAPHEVLGLTFTRKAAGELSVRVRHRLAGLAAVLGWPEADGEPTVSTYDAFAARVLAEHGARLGLESDRRLLSPAAAWQRAARLVHEWDGPMDEVDYAPDTVVGDLLDLHEQACGHLATLPAVADQTTRLVEAVVSLPPGARQQRPVHSGLATGLRAQRTRLQLLGLVEEYRQGLTRDEVADFATVAEQAARLALDDPAVGAALRGQFRVVLLDEYQDTSHAQLALLHAVFGPGHPVTAVGDPFQSIYGWRGANADTLTSFAQRFASPPAPVLERTLSTSFRNDRLVLAVANAVAQPLRADASGPTVASLEPALDAGVGEVRVALHRTAADEALALARQVDTVWRAGGGDHPWQVRGDERPSVAVLVRKRDQIPLLEAALRERDLPVEVVGLDGLLTLPEVADVVALLRLLADPTRGDAFMRLLTGPLLALGPRDLDALGRWSRRLAQDAPADDPPGIVETLDRPPPPGWLTDAAGDRLRAFAACVARLRARLSRPLVDVVADAVRTLRLDVETSARACRTGGVGTAHLDRLADEAAAFAELSPQAGLVEFLAYLSAAQEQERGLRRAAEVHLGARIQVATVHAAKGLEWDVVAVAGLCDGVFPATGRSGAAWVSDPGTLPYPLRGDAARLPRLDLAGPADQSQLASAVARLVEDGRVLDLAEERRLAYVALTRARHVLLCHGHRWGTPARPREPSAFLHAVAGVPGVQVDVWVEDPGERPGPGEHPPVWPVDLLGPRRADVEQGAALVRAAVAGGDGDLGPGVASGRLADAEAGLSPAAAGWAREVELLLAERAAAGRRAALPQPAHLAASQLVALRRDAEAFAVDVRRPMPRRPRPEARRGTAFHTWVEQFYGDPQLLDLDELPGASDAGDPPAGHDLEQLQQAFLAAGWGERTPREVEAAFELVLGEVVVRGRADAVFDDGDGLLVVDWKTGPPPRDPAEAQARSTQLAVYRLAFAALHGLPLERVRAAFHHVREGVTIAGSDLAGRDELDDLVRRLAVPSAGSAG
jgi:DNA helicase-2/ATP-dependent DNA helicase PcrA